MNAVLVPQAPRRAVGPMADPLTTCLAEGSLASGRLVLAMMDRHQPERLARAIEAACAAADAVDAQRVLLTAALGPATRDEIHSEGERLLRAWLQNTRAGDIASFGAELAILIAERRPSRRALAEACRGLKLGKVHPPTIADVIGAIDAAESALELTARQVDALPDRIAAAEALLARQRGTAELTALAARAGAPDARR